MSSRATRDLLRRTKRWLARVAAFGVAVVVLVGVVRGGARYSYCPSMQMVSDTPCCAGDRDANGREADHTGEAFAEVRSRDCCEEHAIGRLPAIGAAAHAPQAFAAPLVSTLPSPSSDASHASSAWGAVAVACLERECRAGPIALARHRAELMAALN